MGRTDANDPTATLAVHCGNRFHADFRPLSMCPTKPLRCRHLNLGADMRRREFITLISGAAGVWPLAAGAQRAGPLSRVGVLMPLLESDPTAQSLVATFRGALAQLGWTEGSNLQIDLRW